MEQIKWLVRYLKYGLLFEYHVRKKDVMDPKHQAVLRYHFEMAEHYHKKIMGERWKG